MKDTRREDYFKSKHSLYSSVFNTSSGKKLLNELEDEMFINRSTVGDPNNIQPNSVIFREGQRSLILRLRNLSNPDFINKQLNLKNQKAE